MKLSLNAFGEEPVQLQLQGNSQEYPEIRELGAVGDLFADVRYTPTLTGGWIRIEIRGVLSLDCARCLEKLTGDFLVHIKLLMEKRTDAGFEWVEADGQEVDEYLVRIGPDMTEIALEHAIAEQVMLNYNLNPLPTLDENNKCLQCGRDASALYGERPAKQRKIDPRWAKLSDLQEKRRSDHDAGPA